MRKKEAEQEPNREEVRARAKEGWWKRSFLCQGPLVLGLTHSRGTQFSPLTHTQTHKHVQMFPLLSYRNDHSVRSLGFMTLVSEMIAQFLQQASS